MADHRLYATQRDSFMRQRSARYVGTNEKGGQVFRNDANVTFVVWPLPGGLIRVVEIPPACNC